MAVETKNPEHEAMMQQMADGSYFKIRLSENPAGADQKWGPQYVAINDYGVRIPRSMPGENKDVIVADVLMKALLKAAETRPGSLFSTSESLAPSRLMRKGSWGTRRSIPPRSRLRVSPRLRIPNRKGNNHGLQRSKDQGSQRHSRRHRVAPQEPTIGRSWNRPGTDADKIQIARNFHYRLQGKEYYKALADDIASTSPATTTSVQFRKDIVAIDSAGTVTLIQGTAATSQALAELPTVPSTKLALAYIEVQNSFTNESTDLTTDQIKSSRPAST